ncbi:MAG: hypothetical protein HZB68_01085 [Candidatus Aenigmarchaeota archaeon]|nr:hypothetical protein [Candidatus Aenigmarchaeota archaeon]
MSRYHRQELIDGWDQEKLRKAKVAIVGDGKLAEYVAIPLAALGVGEIRIIGNGDSRKFLDFDDPQNASKNTAKAKMRKGKLPKEWDAEDSKSSLIEQDMAFEPKYLANCLEKLNSDVKAYGYRGELANEASKYMLNGMDLVIDATNDSFSKSLASDFGKYISITGSGNVGVKRKRRRGLLKKGRKTKRTRFLRKRGRRRRAFNSSWRIGCRRGKKDAYGRRGLRGPYNIQQIFRH